MRAQRSPNRHGHTRWSASQRLTRASERDVFVGDDGLAAGKDLFSGLIDQELGRSQAADGGLARGSVASVLVQEGKQWDPQSAARLHLPDLVPVGLLLRGPPFREGSVLCRQGHARLLDLVGPGDLGQVSAPLRLFVGDLRLVPLQRARDLRCLAVEGVVPVLVRVLYAVAGPGAATVRLPALGRDGGDGDDPGGHGASLVCSSPYTTGIGRKRLRRTRFLLVSVVRACTSSGARASR